jgi:hypothetical protein
MRHKSLGTSEQIRVKSSAVRGTALTTGRAGFLNTYFYFLMSLLITGVIVFGFSRTIDKHLIHPALPRPFILYLHAAVFSGWLAFFIFQSALIRTHNVRLHRQTGWFGVALGIAIPVLGVSTAITMARFNILHLQPPNTALSIESFLIVPLFDITAFTIPFALAILWRKKPEFHRRLILLGTCALTAAGFGRFPDYFHPVLFYAGVDLLILLGVVRDLIVNRRIHPVYLYGLPAFILCQIVVMYTIIHNSPYWLRIAHALVS